MAVSGDISVTQDSDHGNVKLHPYLVTLVRWCMSCVWSTATVLLHRLMTAPLQPITGLKPPPLPQGRAPGAKPRWRAGTEHLHPEPKVECQLLHQPVQHDLDVIFVHGLYGSLGNTWRQGDWRQKYENHPQKVPLRDHSKPNSCACNKTKLKNNIYNENECKNANITELNEPEISFTKINEKLSKKIIPKVNDLITEQFYNNTLIDQVEIVDNYDTQAKFVKDLFKKENVCDNINSENNDNECKYDKNNHVKEKQTKLDNDFKCNKTNEYNEHNETNEYNECKCSLLNEKKCQIGCGCMCIECYSDCWPKDWIKEDFPGARVISINYTSDPYLWRPLWIRENKRLNLYQRAEQMIEQLLAMGVGEKPIVWVGHSKGGLFIKQIYCEAYESYMKANKRETPNTNKVEQQTAKRTTGTTTNEQHNGITADNIDTIIGHFSYDDNNSTNNDNYTGNNDNYIENNGVYNKNVNCVKYNDNCTESNNNITKIKDIHAENKNNAKNNVNYFKNNDNQNEKDYNYTENNDNTENNSNNIKNNNNYTINNDNCTEMKNNHTENIHNLKKYSNNLISNNSIVVDEIVPNKNNFEQINDTANNDHIDINHLNDSSEVNGVNDNLYNLKHENESMKINDFDIGNESRSDESSKNEGISPRASLWSQSRGFMFYSVPHRGSPLADIKTPVTARSVDLLEIAKDCPLVLDLQSRWLAATEARGAGSLPVRGLVETCRTLMSVLWLRIVSTESADAGIGVLTGISVDHREICKPTSRSCLLYTELTELISEAIDCRCHK